MDRLQRQADGMIRVIRGLRVMLDTDLAILYGVSTRLINQAVVRNRIRFPADFAFQLSVREWEDLRLQTSGWGGRRYTPFAFTEEGVGMLSSVLRSKRAAIVNVAIMRAFVRQRDALALHKELAAKIGQLERKVVTHDAEIGSLFEEIKRLAEPPAKLTTCKTASCPPGPRS